MSHSLPESFKNFSASGHRQRPSRVALSVLNAAYLAVMVAFFVFDMMLPRGPAAIGYCLIPVQARRLGDRRFLIVVTGICTILTWIGFLIESPGAAAWMSMFDRAMVTGVLWLTLLLVWRQMDAEIALTKQAQLLQKAVSDLHRSNEELENFASVVSHDLRGGLDCICDKNHLSAIRHQIGCGM